MTEIRAPQSSVRTTASHARRLVCCRACGLIQSVPVTALASTHNLGTTGSRLFCARCDARIEQATDERRHAARNRWAAALALAALVIYPAALSLPMLRIERFGHTTDTTIREGVVALVRDGHVAVGVLVFVCSVLAPALKLAAILVLVWASSRKVVSRTPSQREGAGGGFDPPDAASHFHDPAAGDHETDPTAQCNAPALQTLTATHRRRLHQAVEFLGRWGMLDVMLVAVLVAAVKLGDLMSVSPGAGVFLYAAMVVLSLIASAAFDPRALWASSAPTFVDRRLNAQVPNKGEIA